MSAPVSLRSEFTTWDPRRARVRFAVSIVAALATGFFCPGSVHPLVRLLAGWDAGAVVSIALAWWIIANASPQQTRRRAAAEDPGRSAVWAIVLAASTFSLFAATVVLRRARSLAPEHASTLIVLALVGVAAAWTLTHTSYTLRYAHLYYRDDQEGGEGGLCFPGDGDPNDFDFAYFSFTIGMCFQTSDVTVTHHLVRRAVLGHSLLSFVYNTTILALALNLVFGLLG